MKKRNGFAGELDRIVQDLIDGVIVAALEKKVTSTRHGVRGVPLPKYRALRKQLLFELDKRYARAVTKAAFGNVSEAARIAGIDRKHLWRLMRRTGVKAL